MGKKIIVCMPSGRKSYMEILINYLLKEYIKKIQKVERFII